MKITPQGKVKVLDFGLAKAIAGDPSSPDATQSPTITAAATQAGVVIGTAAYMSPEQARGRVVDKRSDIWSFGVVVYEMLSGRKAFEGETISDTLAAVLRADVDWSALPARTPAPVRRVLRRCLDRDLKTRFHDVADARIAMDETPEPVLRGDVPATSERGHRAPWWIAAGLAVAASTGWWLAIRPRPEAPVRVTGFAVTLPEEVHLPFDDSPLLEVSRDGTRLVFVGDRGGPRLLYVRSLDRLDPVPVAGSEGAYSPFFSPDGQWIAFFADGKLKKVPAAGGVAVGLAEAPNNRGGVWLDDDTIVFAPTFTSGLQRVSAHGGKVETVTRLDAAKGERTHRWPACLPGDPAVLFTIGLLNGPGNYDQARLAVWESGSGKVRPLLEGGSMARFAPPDHLVFWRAGMALAVSFDPRRRVVEGEPVVLAEKIGGDPSSGVAYAALSAEGTLAYVPGGGPQADRRLVITDRTGKPRPIPSPPRSYHYPRFSPDGKQIAVTIGPGHGNADDIWICDVATGGLTRLTFGDGNGNFYPVWSPDGTRIAYSSDRAHQGIFFKNADGSGVEEPLQPDARPQIPQDWSRDGSRLAMNQGFPGSDAMTVSLLDRRESLVEKDAGAPVFSPDGRWLAYIAPLSAGSPQVLVRPVAAAGGKVQVTSDWGSFPVWTDREIVYLEQNQKISAMEVATSPTFRRGAVHELFDSPFERGSGGLREYDVTRDGQAFVFISISGERLSKNVDVIVHWDRELARQAPSGRK